MGEFFKGWRRKVGIITLAMACVFMAGWVRSLFKEDAVTIDRYQLWHFNGLFGVHDLATHYQPMLNAPSDFRKKIRAGQGLPYWWIVAPSTGVSAYLLLVKPRVAKPKTTVEPDRA